MRLRFLSSNVGQAPDWEAAVEEFLEDLRLRRYSPHTVEWYQYVLGPFGRYLEEEIGTDDVTCVTEQHVRTFLAQMAEDGSNGNGGVSGRRLNHYREGVKRFYDWMMERGYVGENPASGIGKVHEEKKIIQTLTDEQIEALLRQPDRERFVGLRDLCFLILLLDTGLRLSEALGLREKDIDLDRGSVTVMGKGSVERCVGMSFTLCGELARYLRVRDAALEQIGRPESPWIFPNDVGGRLCSKTMQQRVRRYGDEAGIEGVRVSPHTLRHTYAVNFVRKGGDPFTLQRILGHRSLEMTRRYCELAEADVVERQRQFSPLKDLNLTLTGDSRIKRRPMSEW